MPLRPRTPALNSRTSWTTLTVRLGIADLARGVVSSRVTAGYRTA